MWLLAANRRSLDLNGLDYFILLVYFALVITIGFLVRRTIKTSEDFFLAGRSLPAWVTGLAFISANLGATEILGMAAYGAQYGVSTIHYYWIGAVPAMVFLGIVMMPFYYGSRVRSVPECLRRRSFYIPRCGPAHCRILCHQRVRAKGGGNQHQPVDGRRHADPGSAVPSMVPRPAA